LSKINSMNLLKKLFSDRKKVVGLTALLAVVGWFGWRIFAVKSEKLQFQTTPVERGMIVSSISVSGQIVSSNMMEITTQASGLVKKVYVKNGDKVKKGDKILEIELDLQGEQKNAQAWSSYLSAKNSLETAKANLYSLDSSMWAANQKFINDAVARGLAENDPTYIQQRDDWLAAEAKYKNQQAVISQAQAAVNNAWLAYQLSSPIVVAPRDGIITGLSVVEGMTINSNSSSTKVAVVQTKGAPIASFNLSEIDVCQIKPGQKATIVLDSFPDKTYTGKVVGVDRVGTVTSGVTQYPVVVRLDTSAPEILPHMAATAKIIIESKENVLLVPSSAVQTQNGQSYVRVLKNGQVQMIPVETGLVSDTQTEIVSGLAEGDLVVTSMTASWQRNEESPFRKGMGGMMKMVR